jgi:hypothetical protein
MDPYVEVELRLHHASQRPLSNLLLVTARLKWPERCKKAKIFVAIVEISGVSCQILAGVEMSNLKKGSRITPLSI